MEASAYFYVVPEARDYLQPTIALDAGHGHFEVRWNYEGLQTGSAWAGYNLTAGKPASLAFTPMVGAVFGNVSGVAPGFRLTGEWRKLEAYAEGEFVVDLRDRNESFLYMWSELTTSPLD